MYIYIYDSVHICIYIYIYTIYLIPHHLPSPLSSPTCPTIRPSRSIWPCHTTIKRMDKVQLITLLVGFYCCIIEKARLSKDLQNGGIFPLLGDVYPFLRGTWKIIDLQ